MKKDSHPRAALEPGEVQRGPPLPPHFHSCLPLGGLQLPEARVIPRPSSMGQIGSYVDPRAGAAKVEAAKVDGELRIARDKFVMCY